MTSPGQGYIKDINIDLPDEVSNHPSPHPLRKLQSTQQHRNGKPSPRLPETVNLVTIPNENNDTNTLTTCCDVCTGNAFAKIIPECTFLNQSGHSETNETRNKIHSWLEANMSDRLDKYFTGDLFKQSSDINSEIKPRLYIPDFSTRSRGIDAVLSTNGIDLTTLQGARLQNQSESVIVPTKSTTHFTNTPSQSLRPHATENQSDSASSKRSNAFLNTYFRENSNYHINPSNTFKYIQDYDSESDEKDIWYTPTPRQQDLKKLREFGQEVNPIQQLQEDTEIVNTHHPRLSTRLSVSDSDIYIFRNFKDNMLGQDINNERNAIKSDHHDMNKSPSIENINRRTKHERSSTTKHYQPDIRASSSCENIKSKITKLRGKTTKREKDSSDGTPQKLSIKVDAGVELSCRCKRACERVNRLVTAPGGFMWVSFKQCSFVSLYNNRHENVYMFDTRGSVDSMALSATGVLYVSCPPQRRIIMLSSNLQMTVLRSFSKLYPQGVAVSPDNGTVVVCITSQVEGYEMTGPSKNSCLMRFKGKTPNETGTIVNKGNHFGYPVKVTVNMDGFLLVSDFGLRCMFVLDKGGNMLRTFSSLGGWPIWHVHALTSNNTDMSFLVVQGGGETLSIIRLGEFLGTFEEKSTSTKHEPLIKQNVETASMNTDGQIVVASGNIVTHVSLVYSP